jgi:hypothetical protein
MKHISSTMKCIRDIDNEQTPDITDFLICSVHLNMGIISGTTHIKTIFSFHDKERLLQTPPQKMICDAEGRSSQRITDL